MHTTEESDNTCLMVETQTEILPSGPVDAGYDGGDGRGRAEEDATAAADAADQDPFGLDDPAPCAEPVDGAGLLHEIVGTIRRHVSVTYDSAVAMALWTIFTYAHDAFSVSPLLCFCSPEKRCGKTTVMTLICNLVRKALLAANISPAAVYRTIGEHRPTLLVDEADTFLRANLPLRGILNAGHTRATAKVIRTGGSGFKPQAFSTWCPKVVALIGKLSGTLEDRSIVVPMRRKAVTESLMKLGSTAHQDLAPLRSRIARWVLDNDAALRAGRPGVPESLNDRAADNWTPLLTIADLAGGEWPEAARRAAVAMVPVDQDEENLSVALLRDVRRAFAEANRQRLFTADLIDRLTAMEESPWRTARGSHRLDPHMLAMSLKPYEIMPTLLRVGNKVGRGYDISACQDAFERYLPADRSTVKDHVDAVPGRTPSAQHQPSGASASVANPRSVVKSYTVTTAVDVVTNGCPNGARHPLDVVATIVAPACAGDGYTVTKFVDVLPDQLTTALPLSVDAVEVTGVDCATECYTVTTNVTESDYAGAGCHDVTDVCCVSSDDMDAVGTNGQMIGLSTVGSPGLPAPQAFPGLPSTAASDAAGVEFLRAAKALKKAAFGIRGFSADQAGNVAALAKEINTIGFVFSQLLPLLVQTGEHDDIALARVTIGELTKVTFEHDPDDPPPGGKGTGPGTPESEEVAANPVATPGEPQAETSALAASDWPPEPGMKIVLGVSELKKAVRRAGLAAISEQGQCAIARTSNETKGCVRISACCGSITFDSAVPMFSARHIVPAGTGSDAWVESAGAVCVPAKELKAVICKRPDGQVVSLAFRPKSWAQDNDLSVAAQARFPDGVVEVGCVKDGRIAAKTSIDSYPVAFFEDVRYPDPGSLAVVVSGQASCMKVPYGLVGFAINPKDFKEVHDKLAIYTDEKFVTFVGADRDRSAVARFKADVFEETAAAVSPGPVLIEATYLTPALAALKKGDPIVLGLDGADHVCLVSGTTCYRFRLLDKKLREKYPSLERLTGLAFDAIISVDRQALVAAAETVCTVNKDRCYGVVDSKEGLLRFSGRGVAACHEAGGTAAYALVGERPIRGERFCLHTGCLLDGLRKMTADRIRMSFTTNERLVRIEDETAPQFAYYMRVMDADQK